MFLGSAINCAGGALIRYVYVKDSLRKDIQEVFKRHKFTFLCFVLPQVQYAWKYLSRQFSI